MTKPNTIYVDNTLLSSLACSTRALLRHAHGYTAEGPTSKAKLYAGTSGHSALEAWLKGASATQALSIFEQEYRTWSDEHLAIEAPASWENVSEILEAWLAEHTPEDLPLTIPQENIEVGFQLPLNNVCTCGHSESQHKGRACTFSFGERTDRNGMRTCACENYTPEFIFYGRFDAWGTDASNELYVLDHKFTGWVNDAFFDAFRLSSQMRGYAWALQRTLGQRVSGFYINAIQAFRKLPQAASRSCRVHQVAYSVCRKLHIVADIRRFTVSEKEMAEWHANALILARHYRSLCERYPNLRDVATAPTEGLFMHGCRWCEFATFCETGRPLHLLGSVLKHEPWRPFATTEENS